MQPTQTQVSKTRGRTLVATAPEYRVLGLRPREARLEVIRRALAENASQLRSGEIDSAESEDERLAEVLVAAYRLMDPRRRPNLLERVQLLLWTEDDLERPSASLWDERAGWAAEMERADEIGSDFVVAQPATGAQGVDVVALPIAPGTRALSGRSVDEQPQDEARVALDVFRMLKQRDRHATALRIAVVALVFSLLSAVAVVSALLLY